MAVLTYKEFSAAPDFAVKEAYLLNLAQAAVMVDREGTGEVLADYAAGDVGFNHVEQVLSDIVNEAADAAEAEIAATKEG